jgi:hypothetical protein
MAPLPKNPFYKGARIHVYDLNRKINVHLVLKIRLNRKSWEEKRIMKEDNGRR